MDGEFVESMVEWISMVESSIGIPFLGCRRDFDGILSIAILVFCMRCLCIFNICVVYLCIFLIMEYVLLISFPWIAFLYD